MTLRHIAAAFAALFLAFSASPLAAAEPAATSVEMWRNANCGCCGKWAAHLEANGFTVKINESGGDKLRQIKKLASVSPELESCHTAKVGGYLVEGHVPAADVQRLLAEKPDAVGLVVPGMPVGSPGMEVGSTKEPYDVLLLKKDGSTEVWAKH